jgi:YVTN family beta-propeller protein
MVFAGSARAQVTNYAVVPNTNSGNVSVIDTVNSTTVGTASVGGHPNCSAMTKDGRFAYVTTRDGGTVKKIDLSNATVSRTITVGGTAICVAISPDERTAYVTNWTGPQVQVLDLTTDADTGITIPVGTLPHGLAITPDGTRLYVANLASNTVTAIDTATYAAIATIPVATSPIAVFVRRDGLKVYVAANGAGGKVAKIDVATNTVDTTIAVSPGANALDESMDGQWIYSADYQTGKIDVISTATDAVTTFSIGTALTGVAFTPDGQHAWVMDRTLNRITRLSNLSAPSADANITVGAAPAGLTPFLGPNLIVGPGPLAISGDADLVAGGFGTDYVDFNGGTLQLQGDWTSTRTVSLLMIGGTIDTNGATATLTGGTVGNGWLFKKGSGRLILSGTAQHPSTAVQGGVLQFDGMHIKPITATGLIAGSGTIDSADVFGPGGVAPGGASTTGILTAVGVVTFHTGSTFAVRLNGPTAGTDYDRLVTYGGAVLNDATLNVTLGYMPTGGTTFTILTNASGTFNGLPEGSIVTVSGQTFHLTYHGGSGSDVQLQFDGAPALSSLSNVTRAGSLPPVSVPVSFTVVDDLSMPVMMTATSSNQTLVPNANLGISMVCTTGTLIIMPAIGQSGSTTITLTASDGLHTVQQSFLFTITNAPPTITGLGDHTIDAGASLGPLSFTIGDDLKLPDALVLSATSSNTTLLPNVDLVLGGSGATRTLTATPALGVSGTTQITVSAFDGIQTTTARFNLSVGEPPTYFLAEGSTGSFFDTDILLANPNTIAAPVTLTFYKDDGTTVVQSKTCRPRHARPCTSGTLPDSKPRRFRPRWRRWPRCRWWSNGR